MSSVASAPPASVPPPSSAIFAPLAAEKNLATYAWTVRLLFFAACSASLLAIAYSQDAWAEAAQGVIAPQASPADQRTSVITLYDVGLSTGSYRTSGCDPVPTPNPSPPPAVPTPNPAAVCQRSVLSGALSQGVSSGYTDMRFAVEWASSCANAAFVPPSPFCLGLSSMLGVAIFLRVLFPLVLLLLGAVFALAAEALLRMAWRAKGDEGAPLVELRPRHAFPVLCFVWLAVLVIVIAQPASVSALLASMVAPSYTLVARARPGSSWFLTFAALVLLKAALFAAYSIDALGGGVRGLGHCPRGCCAARGAGAPPLPAQQYNYAIAGAAPGGVVSNPAFGGAPSPGSGKAPAAKSASAWTKMKDEEGTS